MGVLMSGKACVKVTNGTSITIPSSPVFRALVSSSAARKVHVPNAVLHCPSPGNKSCASPPSLTTNAIPKTFGLRAIALVLAPKMTSARAATKRSRNEPPGQADRASALQTNLNLLIRFGF